MRGRQPLMDGKADLWDDLLVAGRRVMEMLSDHQCQEWLEGYLPTVH
jgi:phosphoketolase